MVSADAGWMVPILGSALALGFYDLCKKHAVRENTVMPVLFFATLTGTTLFVVASLVSGHFAEFAACSHRDWWLIAAKSLLVGSSWTCVYYAMRDLPISIAAPVRASAPLWTFLGSLVLFHEIPTPWQGVAMVSIFAGYYGFSVLGKLEGFSLRHPSIHLIMAGTLLGAASSLYDKYLLGVLRIPRNTVQLWFSIDIAVLLGAAYLLCLLLLRKKVQRKFQWRWSIPLTGILLIVADWLYFYTVSLPDTQISIISLVRRCSCIVTFAAGSWYFHDTNIRGKVIALGHILLGVILLALA